MTAVRRALVALLLAVVAGCTAPAGGEPARPDEVPSGVAFASPPSDAPAAPDLELVLLDGTTITASSLWAQRPVVIVFFSSWCGACEQTHREVAEIVGDRPVALLGVAGQDDAEAVAAYVRRLGLDHPVALDESGDAWRRYAVDEPPLVALVSRGGRLLRGWPGGVDGAVLAEALSGLTRSAR